MRQFVILAFIFLVAACTSTKKVAKFSDNHPRDFDSVAQTFYKERPGVLLNHVEKLYPYRRKEIDTVAYYDTAAMAEQVFYLINLADSAYQEFIREYYVPRDSANFNKDSAIDAMARNLIGATKPCKTVYIRETFIDSLRIKALEEEIAIKDSLYAGQLALKENQIQALNVPVPEKSKGSWLWAVLAVLAAAVFFLKRKK